MVGKEWPTCFEKEAKRVCMIFSVNFGGKMFALAAKVSHLTKDKAPIKVKIQTI